MGRAGIIKIIALCFLSNLCSEPTKSGSLQENRNGQLKPALNRTSFKLIASKDEVSLRGTGFVIQKKNNYYLITAKHLFFPASVQKDYTAPTFSGSNFEVSILSPKDFSEIQKEPLVNAEAKSLLYRTFDLEENRALDIAVLKINKPSNELKEHSMPFSILETGMKYTYKEPLLTEGYPTRTKIFHSTLCSFAPKELQEMLDKDGTYYFIISTEEDLEGISGGPIFTLNNASKNKLIGIFVGQNRKVKNLGYGVHAFYISEIISSF
jgi:hypothetical protein